MNLSKAQQNDLETIQFFIPPTLRHITITDRDIEMFLENSEQGKHKDKIRLSHFDDGFNALITGKIKRGMHMGLFEEGMLEGTTPYMSILEGKPRAVVEFMKKEMFKGRDARLIEECYEMLLNTRDEELKE